MPLRARALAQIITCARHYDVTARDAAPRLASALARANARHIRTGIGQYAAVSTRKRDRAGALRGVGELLGFRRAKARAMNAGAERRVAADARTPSLTRRRPFRLPYRPKPPT